MKWMEPQLPIRRSTAAREPTAVHWFVPSEPWINRHPKRSGDRDVRLVARRARWHVRLGAVATRR